MFDFRRRSSRALTLASIMVLSSLFAVACDPYAELDESGEVVDATAPEFDESGEVVDATAPEFDESGEVVDATAPEFDESGEVAVGSITPEGLEQQQSALTPLPTPPGLRSVAAWETLFLNRWNSEHTGFLRMSNSLDSWQFYNLAYGIDGNTAMYRATGKTQYLDRALLYVNNMVRNARVSTSLPRSNFRDSYLGWVSARSDTVGQQVPLFESYCWRYVTRLLRVIRETPELYNNANYRSQYDRLLAFTERNIFEKWLRRGANAYIYRVNTHMASHWAYMAMDLSRMTTDAARRNSYLTVFNNINRDLPNYNSSLRQQMRISSSNPAAYFWSSTWGSSSRPGQDVAHANGVLAYVVEARDANMEWTATDMNRFTTTLNSIIWPSATRYASYVDGSGSGTGWFNDGLMKLGRYNANLQRRLETHRVGQNTQFYGNAALNVRLLSEAAAR